MKHILVLSHSPYVGGAELALKSLIEPLKNDFKWTVVVTSKVPVDERVKNPGVNYVNLELPWWCHEAHDKAPAIAATVIRNELSSLARLAESADLLLTNTITVPWLGIIARQLGKPHVWYIHEFGDIDHNLQFMLGYDRSLEYIQAASSRVLTISTAVKKHLAQVIPEDEIDIIHQAVDLSTLTRIEPAPPVPKRLLCLGAIKPSKGQHIALRAMTDLGESMGYTLDIIGPAANASYAEQVRAEAAQLTNVSVQIRSYEPAVEFASHDCLLMCSENEALGRVTLEALAAGRMVIGFASESTRELLDQERGILYEPNEPGELARAIRSSKKFKYSVSANRNFVTDTYGDDRQSQDFRACVDTVQPVGVDSTSSIADELIQLFTPSPAQGISVLARKLVPTRLKHVLKSLRH